jgi:hypothetical protein
VIADELVIAAEGDQSMLLPEKDTPNDAYIIRTDFSNAAGWQNICDAICQSLSELDYKAQFIEDQGYDGATPQDLLPDLEGSQFHTIVFIVDRVSIETPDYPVLVLDLYTEPGRTFRLIPEWMPNVQANLWLANMDFADYADSVDPDGVFRGFANG